MASTPTPQTLEKPARTLAFARFLYNNAITLAFGPALAALLGSLYYSEIARFTPCTLCWYQRILMYPLSVILLVAIFTQDLKVYRYVLPLTLTGIGVSTYHILVENGLFGDSTVCSMGVSCAVKYVNYFGFLTIPTQALIAFVMITVLMFGLIWSQKQEDAIIALEESEISA